MSAPAAEPAPLTQEEADVSQAAALLFETMARCEQAGGDANRGFLAAIPPELLEEAKRQVPLLGFLGL